MDIKIIRKKVKKGEYDLSDHAHKERQEEQITTEEIEKTLLKGAIIEKYPEDPRGESCLVTSKTLHIVCGFRGQRCQLGSIGKQEVRRLRPVFKCYFCKGKTEIKNIDVDFRWGNKLYVVQNVPVEVCSQCGEKYYSAEVSKKLDELIKESSQSKKPQEVLEVPVFNWQ